MPRPALLAGLLFTALAAQAAPVPATPPPHPARSLLPTIVWPTPNRAFLDGKPFTDFIQPTAMGTPQSGLFGNVRNDGYKFHEGLDLKPVGRDARGEPTDKVFAAMPGRVAFTNAVAGSSDYGRYVVLVHPTADVPIYTLYAHLASIDPATIVGREVSAGTVLAVMGRSANHTIGLEQAHMHFEMGVRLSNDFDSWYARYNPKEPNKFDNYHGWNVVGFDPLEFMTNFRAGKVLSFRDHLWNLPTAFTLRVPASSTPWFLREYPALLTAPVPAGLGAFDIEYSWYGLPKRWTPVKAGIDTLSLRGRSPQVMSFDPAQFSKSRRKLIQPGGGGAVLTELAQRELALLFGWR